MQQERSNRQLALAMGLAVAFGAVVLLLAALAGGDSAGAEASVEVAPELLSELADGGEVLLLRHALTDRSQTDADPQARGGCAQQRNLSPEGVAQAERIGAGMRAAGVPVGEVYVSPFCRTRDTGAALGFGAPVDTDALLSLTSAPDQAGAEATTVALRSLVAEVIGSGDTPLLVTHTQNIEALTGLTVEEGDAVVLSADGSILGVIPASDWG